MFLKRKMNDSTGSYSDKILQIKEKIREADAIIIGAGAGLSTSAGFVYNGERFEKYFLDFRKKYGFSDMYAGGFYPYKTLEKHWKNIGDTGADISILIAIWMHQNRYIRTCMIW